MGRWGDDLGEGKILTHPLHLLHLPRLLLQACMQVALASKRRAPPHVVDINASVFLSLNTLAPCSQLQALPSVVRWYCRSLPAWPPSTGTRLLERMRWTLCHDTLGGRGKEGGGRRC